MEFELSELSKTDIEEGGIEWPGHCRNCQAIYVKELKGMVTRMIVYENKDLLKAITMSFLELGITRYCCINNYKPRKMSKRELPKVVKDIFCEIRPQVFIDKTMMDWMDIKWDDDVENTVIENKNNMSKNSMDVTVSLFDL